MDEIVSRRFPGYATEMVEYSSGAWEVVAHDVNLLASAFGEGLLWALCRCFEAADRLMSLATLVPSDKEHRIQPTKAMRDHFTAFWLSAGTMRELALAILALPGMRKRLHNAKALDAYDTLVAIAHRWNSDPFVRVRNAMSFHVDSYKNLFRLGVVDLQVEGTPVVLACGDNPKHGHFSFPFGREVFTRGLWPEVSQPHWSRAELLESRQQDFEKIAASLVRDQTHVGGLLQSVLVELLRPGRAITPDSRLSEERSRLWGLLRQRALRDP